MTRANARGERRRRSSAAAADAAQRTSCRSPRWRSRTSRSRWSLRSRRAWQRRALIASGYRACDRSAARRLHAALERRELDGWAAELFAPRLSRRSPRAAGRGAVRSAAMRFSVEFLGCKVSHVDAQEIRERAARRRPPGGRRARPTLTGARQLLLRHRRGGREEPQGRGPRRPQRPSRSSSAAAPRRCRPAASRRLPERVRVLPGPAETVAAQRLDGAGGAPAAQRRDGAL